VSTDPVPFSGRAAGVMNFRACWLCRVFAVRVVERFGTLILQAVRAERFRTPLMTRPLQTSSNFRLLGLTLRLLGVTLSSDPTVTAFLRAFFVISVPRLRGG